MSQNGSARRSGITQSVAESVPSRDEIAKNIPPTIAPMSTYRQAGMSKLTSSHPSGAASALIRRSFSRRDRLVMGSVSSRSPTFDRLRVVGASSYGAARGAGGLGRRVGLHVSRQAGVDSTRAEVAVVGDRILGRATRPVHGRDDHEVVDRRRLGVRNLVDEAVSIDVAAVVADAAVSVRPPELVRPLRQQQPRSRATG